MTISKGFFWLVAIPLTLAGNIADCLLHEQFTPGWEQRWKHSTHADYGGKFQAIKAPGTNEMALQITEKNQKYGLTALLPQPLDPTQGLVLQYEVQFIHGHDCSGAYLKLLPHDDSFTPELLDKDTPYTIMFGPDRCGPNSRVHLIMRSKNPVTGKLHERHLEDPPVPPVAENKLTHMYTLKLMPDDTFSVLIDGKEKSSGSLLDSDEFFPPFQPPLEIPDPEHVKPEDWVEVDEIDDPDAVKPSTWDDRRTIPDEQATLPEGWLEHEATHIPDPTAKQPKDWDTEEDGPWEAPLIPNPKCSVGCGAWQRPTKRNPAYKGPWIPPRIPNPDYKGEWRQRYIKNPDYYKESSALGRLGLIGAAAIEVWATDQGYTFGNILLDSDDTRAAAAREVFLKKHEHQVRTELEKFHSSKYSHLPWAAQFLFHLMDQSWMTWAKPKVAPAMQVLWDQPHLAYFILVLPMFIALLSILFSTRRSSKGAGGGAGNPGVQLVNGEALSAEEMEEYLEEQKRISRAAAAAIKRRSQGQSLDGQQQQQGGAAGTGGQPGGSGQQAAAGKEVESQGEGKGTVRRRPGRA